ARSSTPAEPPRRATGPAGSPLPGSPSASPRGNTVTACACRCQPYLVGSWGGGDERGSIRRNRLWLSDRVGSGSMFSRPMAGHAAKKKRPAVIRGALKEGSSVSRRPRGPRGGGGGPLGPTIITFAFSTRVPTSTIPWLRKGYRLPLPRGPDGQVSIPHDKPSHPRLQQGECQVKTTSTDSPLLPDTSWPPADPPPPSSRAPFTRRTPGWALRMALC